MPGGTPQVIPQRYEAAVPLDALTPHPANPNQSDVGLLSQLLGANGFAGAVLAQESTGLIVDGHGRLAVARAEGMATIPVMWLDISDDTRDRLLASLNESVRRGMNDEAALVALLQGLAATPRGLEGTAFDGDDLDALIAGLGGQQDGGGNPLDGDPDDVPEPPAEPVSRPGDLWLLGNHRLLCGDSRVPDDLDRLLAGAFPDAILTDPPYGMKLDTDYTIRPRGSDRGLLKDRPAKTYRPVIGDDEPFDANFLATHFAAVPEQFWFGGDYYRRTLSEHDTDGSWLVWDKRGEGADNGIGSGFELIWSKQKHKRDLLRYFWYGAFGAEAGNREHPTQKPTKLLAEIIDRWIKPGSLIIDLFAGSGSTLIAAHSLGRVCYLMELDGGYCDTIAARWERCAGVVPERVLGDGKTEPVSFTREG